MRGREAMSLLSAAYGTDSEASDDDDDATGLVAYMDDDDEQGQGRRIKVAESAASSSRAPPEAAEGGSAANGSSVMVDSGRANGAVDNAAVTATDGGRSAADGAADAADGGTQHGLLPSRPTAPPAADVMRRVERLFREKRKGTNLNELIRTMRPYQNPSIYEKLIDMMEIDQIGSNCPPEVYDPKRWGAEDYFDKLTEARTSADVQRADAARRKRVEAREVLFVSGTVRNPPPVISSLVVGKSRRSSVDPTKLEAARQEVARRAAAIFAKRDSQ
eukprot:m.29366 g.29366  ORF g.29366 m.29366 type:complete len:275 (+) comp12105_c0_seq1:157-981(+)